MEIVMLIICAVVIYVILYFVVKAAVRDGIVEARQVKNAQVHEKEEGTEINQTTCQNCGRDYDIDYPKCPYCKRQH